MMRTSWILGSIVVAAGLAGVGCERERVRAEERERAPMPERVQPTTPEQPGAQPQPGAPSPRMPAEEHGAVLMLTGEGGKKHVLRDAALIREVEQKLHAAGMDPGAIDGVYDARTAGAISSFQQSQGLSRTGHLDAATAKALGMDWDKLMSSAQPHMGETKTHEPGLGERIERGGEKMKRGLEGLGEEITPEGDAPPKKPERL